VPDPRVRLSVAGRTARLELARPEKRNALDQAMWEAIPPLVEAAMANPAVRLLVLASATPGMFAAGADIAEFATASADPAWRAANREAIRAAQLSLARAPKPTLAIVDGDCVGGGCGLAIACDLRIASPRARFGITPAKLGLVYPLHDTRLLVDLVGPAWAKRLLTTGALIDAATALRIGLATDLADDPEALAAHIATELAATSGASHRWAKATVARVLDGATDDDAASLALFDAAFTGADFAEGVAAFLARRPPAFS
jgi:enoyl-CoA hydratase/carnithine racemase